METNKILNNHENVDDFETKSLDFYYQIKKKYFSKFCSKLNDCNVYHYTSEEALYNILSTNSLRFTDAQYLNDINEYNLAKDLMIDVINQHSFENLSLKSTLIKLLDTKNDFKYFVCSFSETKDSMPMWNYFSKNRDGIGVSLEINYDLICSDERKRREIANNRIDDFCLIPYDVIYETNQQIEILKELIDFIETTKFSTSDLERFFICFLDMFCCCFKDKNFEYEMEKRFLLRVAKKNLRELNLQFQNKDGYEIPYIDLNFCKFFNDNLFRFVNSVTLSPIASRDGNLESRIKRFFYENDLDIPIRKSQIKVRY